MKKSMIANTVVAAAALLAIGVAHAQANDTLKKIKDSGSATMGVRESSGALAYTLGDGKYTGFHYDVCQKVFADIQKQLGLAKLDIKYQPVTSQNRIPLVQNGTVDLECGSTTNNATRQKDVAFAPTLYVEEVRIAVKGASGITSIAQLKDKTVATTTGTTSVQLLRKHERANNVDFKELFGKDHGDSFLLLEGGRASLAALAARGDGERLPEVVPFGDGVEKFSHCRTTPIWRHGPPPGQCGPAEPPAVPANGAASPSLPGVAHDAHHERTGDFHPDLRPSHLAPAALRALPEDPALRRHATPAGCRA